MVYTSLMGLWSTVDWTMAGGGGLSDVSHAAAPWCGGHWRGRWWQHDGQQQQLLTTGLVVWGCRTVVRRLVISDLEEGSWKRWCVGEVSVLFIGLIGFERGQSGDSDGWWWMGFDFHCAGYGRGSDTGEGRGGGEVGSHFSVEARITMAQRPEVTRVLVAWGRIF
jgi:hypothetical protein